MSTNSVGQFLQFNVRQNFPILQSIPMLTIYVFLGCQHIETGSGIKYVETSYAI